LSRKIELNLINFFRSFVRSAEPTVRDDACEAFPLHNSAATAAAAVFFVILNALQLAAITAPLSLHSLALVFMLNSRGKISPLLN
jgi:hypothetical protein